MVAKRLPLVLLLASLITIPSLLFAQSRPLKRFQVGVPAIRMGIIIIFFAKEAKIYEKYGLDGEPRAQQSWELFAKHRLAAPYPNIKGMKTGYE